MGVVEKIIKKVKEEVRIYENESNITQDEKVKKIIINFSIGCSIVAIQPIPFADIFVLTPIQGVMGQKIAKARGYSISEAESKEILKEIIGLVGLGIGAQQLAIGAYKTFLPFWGAVTTIPLVFSLSFAIGKVMDYYFMKKVRGELIEKEEIKLLFEKAKKEGKKEAKNNSKKIIELNNTIDN